jgi:hypothetical protein
VRHSNIRASDQIRLLLSMTAMLGIAPFLRLEERQQQTK